MINPVNYDLGRYRRFGIIYEDKIHLGHDYNVAKETIVSAIANGIILDIREAAGFGGWNPSRKGWYIWIQHNDICALYGHVKPFRINVGGNIEERQIIGYVHDYIRDGFSLAHLHFGIWNGLDYPSVNLGYDTELKKWIDPKKYLLRNMVD